MPVTLTASWRARAGEEGEIERILRALVPLTHREPGCLAYTALRSEEDARDFLLYEQYTDQAAFDAHCASDHFKRYVLEEALPRLESRRRSFFSVLADE